MDMSTRRARLKKRWFGQVKTQKRALAPTTDCESGCTVRKGDLVSSTGFVSLHRLPESGNIPRNIPGNIPGIPGARLRMSHSGSNREG
eukprot:1772716-Pyramimonas_sp.AAC.1